MRVFFLVAAVCVAATLAVDEEVLPPLRGMQGFSITFDTPEQFELLRNFEGVAGYDFLKLTPDSLDVFVTADQVDTFKDLLEENQINYRITVEDVERVVTDEYITQTVERALHEAQRDVSEYGKLPFTYYPNYNEVNNYLDYVVQNHKDIASLTNIGTSYEGRPMKVLKLSTGGANKPAIFVDGGIHAREWIAPATTLYILDQLLVNRNLLQKVDWYFIPVLNPDGYEFTHAKSSNRLWRKTRSVNSGSSCRGVDGNRNYDMGWMEIGASSNPCSETYAGPKAFSEKEMQLMRDFVLKNKANIKAYLTFHSYGQYILYPWGYTHSVPANEPELRNLAKEVAAGIAKYRRTQYTYGTSANHLYPAAGGSDDWAMGKAGVKLSYTIELPGGNSGFLLPPSEIKAVGIETFEGVKIIHDYVTKKYASKS